MNPMYITMVASIFLYLILHKPLKTFKAVAWVSFIVGLLTGVIYGALTTNNILPDIIGTNIAGALIALFFIIVIDRFIYGKNPRK